MPSATAVAVSALRSGRARTARSASGQIPLTGRAWRAWRRGLPGSGIASGAWPAWLSATSSIDRAVAHDQDAVGVRRDPGVVGHEHRGLVLLTAEPGEQRHDLVAARPVEVAGRLVGEQERRRGRERAGQRNALLLAAGDLLGAVALETMEVELVHERVDPIADRLPRELLAVPGGRLVAETKRQRRRSRPRSASGAG